MDFKKIRKAVIPAAGYGTRFLPATKSLPKEMFPIIDKPTMQYIVEECVKAGIEDILIITNAQKTAIENHFDRSWELEGFLKDRNKLDDLQMVKDISNLANIYTIRQKKQKGLGHAILCAKDFICDEPFAVLLGDDIVDNEENPAILQLIKLYNETGCSVVGVQEVPHEDTKMYGIVKPLGKIVNGSSCKVSDMVEKPNPADAPSNFAVLGRYVLTPKIFDLLESQKEGSGGEIQLTDAIKRLINFENVYALNFEGKRYDIGSKIGYIQATIDFALKRDDLKDDLVKLLKDKNL